MVIRGRTRGNGKQLGNYLLTEGDNDNIQILDIDGRADCTSRQLQEALLSMSLAAELSRSDKGLYHGIINPDYGEDQEMNTDQWLEAADILGKELGLQEQRRVIVLHSKKGRTHAHVVWQRYDLEKRKLISDSFSWPAHDKAREKMERVFGHRKTPLRNVDQPEMNLTLTELWHKAKTAQEFVKFARKQGYTIAAGEHRRPFMVVDKKGRSFDLVRQLNGIRTKDVRERLNGLKLLSEKNIIQLIRKEEANDNSKHKRKATEYAANRDSMFEITDSNRAKKQFRDFQANQPGISLSKKEKIAKEFATMQEEILLRKEHLKKFEKGR